MTGLWGKAVEFGRRKFLDKSLQGLAAIAGLGWGWQLAQGGDNGMVRAAERYGKSLSGIPNSRRKLALLIGINQYDAHGEWLPLNGCLTDVDLQRELLIHRFGFHPADILTLTDSEATGAAIAQAFTEHLISQTLPGDLVIVHFSGHGSQIGLQKTLVPVDSIFPVPAQDLPLETVLLWLKAIATDNITCVFDTGYIYPGTPVVGNFRVRTRPSRSDWQLSSDQLATQQNLIAQLGNKAKQPNQGIVLQATERDRLCADAYWQGFSSGVYTYALTQQLWQMTPATSIQVVLNNVLSSLEQNAFPPTESPKPESPLPSKSSDGQWEDRTKSSADGVIRTTAIDGKTGETWLAGLPIASLASYGAGSVFAANATKVLVRSQNGLKAKVEVLDHRQSLQPGQLLQEKIRLLPRDLGLAIALDLGLAKIERVDAMSAISDIPQMLGVNAAEQFADCLFGSDSNNYGLFTVGRSPILGSFGAVSESVSAAVRRLRPKLEGLLAAKLIRLTGNQESSGLGLRVKLEVRRNNETKPIVCVHKSTHCADVTDNPDLEPVTNTTLAVGDRLSCHLENLTQEPLYVQIFTFDPRGKVMIPSFVIAPYANDSILPPQQTLVIPSPSVPFDWTVSAPRGLVDVQIIASRFPLTESTALLAQHSRQATSPTSMVAIPNPLQIAQALLGDLGRSPLTEVNSLGAENPWSLDVNDWATLGFTYHVG